MRLAAVILLVLAALGLIYFSLSGSEVIPEATTPEEVSRSVEPDAEALPLAAPAEELEATPARRERAVVEETDMAGVDSLLRGSVILIDDSGAELTDLDGEITFFRWIGNRGEPAEREVVGGAFEIDVSGVERLTVRGLTFGDRKATPDTRTFPVDQGPIVVVARWTALLRLSVLSEETGTHLHGVTLLRSGGWLMDENQHPGRVGASRIVLTDGSSPLDINPTSEEAQSSDTVYFVHSRGFAWKPIHLDLSEGGEREIHLASGGDLSVQIVGEVPHGQAHLRLRLPGQGGSSLVSEFPVHDRGPHEITGLSPGSYRVTLEMGESYSDPISLGTADVEVTAGGAVSCELYLDAPAEQERGRLAGTVVVPTEWKLDGFRLTAKLDGTSPDGSDGEHVLKKSRLEKVPGREDTWSFDFGELPTGTYDLVLSNSGWPSTLEYAIRITLDPGGLLDVLLQLPPPGTVVVRVVTSGSGEIAEISGLRWSPLHPPGGGHASYGSAPRVAGEDHFEFLAPIGEIAIGCFGKGYTSLDEQVHIQTGRNEFTFQVERDCPLVILLFDGETPVPLAGFWYPDPEHLDGEGKILSVSLGGRKGFRTSLSDPGRYVFELPEVPDFEPIPPQTISVRRGEETVHEIQLVRKGR
jgi:hypothetical protein